MAAQQRAAADPGERDLAAGVREVVAELDGRDPGAVRLAHIPGGASRESWLAEFSEGGTRERLVLRRDPPGGESFLPLGLEFRVVEAAAAGGVPVARPLHFEPAGGRFATAGYLMEHVEGTSLAGRILRRDEYAAARGRLVGQLARALARVHALDAAALEGVAPPPDPARAACELWEGQLDEACEPLPAVEAGLRWLRLAAPPPPRRPALVHGDFRLGNFIIDGEGLRAVIDWELCHPGDPAEDVAWLCLRSWRFGNDERPVAGLGSREGFLRAYAAAGGEPPDAARLRWWEALGNVKWAVICARQAADHLSGRRRSAELASLGRRICEPEWDLLALIAAGR